MEDIPNQIHNYFTQYPHLIYLIIGIISLILSIGNFLDKDWAIDPANSSQKFSYELFGHNAFRFISGAIFLLSAIFSFMAAYYYYGMG